MFKSGTSSEFTNLWCIGATPAYTVGVWAGNFDGRAVINKTGSIVPTQIVTEVLTRVTTRAQDFAAPAQVVEARICTVSGQRATPSCPSTRTEFFRSRAELPPPCAYHEDPRAGKTLLRESFLKPAEPARILFPAAGEVFYMDDTLRAGAQRLPIVVAMRSGETGHLLVDGVEIARGDLADPVTVPLLRGSHVAVVQTAAGVDSVHFIVK